MNGELDAKLISKSSSDIERDSPKIQDFFVRMLKINSVNPGMGGPGETARADFIQSFVEAEGFNVTRVEVPDNESGGMTRPSLSIKVDSGASVRTLWFLSHLDTVPEGARELWQNDPFEPLVKDGRIYARGAEDNGQSLAATLFAVRELKLLGLEKSLPFNVGAWFVADEENGSRYGVKYLLDHDYFKPNDLIVVPDAGSPDGASIEIAEKNLLWLKFVVKGKQVHASLPSKGANARRASTKLSIELDSILHEKYKKQNLIFDEQGSTFEPTKVESNVPNVNTIPGVDTFYFDCRVNPEYPLYDVLRDIHDIIDRHKKDGIDITLHILNKEDAGEATSSKSEVSTLLSKAIKEVTKKDAKFVGIGGQTVGNLFRQKGLATVVWSTVDEVPHEPNEYSKFSNLISDAKVFAAMALIA